MASICFLAQSFVVTFDHWNVWRMRKRDWIDRVNDETARPGEENKQWTTGLFIHCKPVSQCIVWQCVELSFGFSASLVSSGFIRSFNDIFIAACVWVCARVGVDLDSGLVAFDKLKVSAVTVWFVGKTIVFFSSSSLIARRPSSSSIFT